MGTFREEQTLQQYLADLTKSITSKMPPEKDGELTCCFTGHRPKRVPWLANDNDHRTLKLKNTLKSLIDNLSIHGVRRYIAGNAEGFDTIAAETVLNSNEYFEISKLRDGVPEEWLPAELEIAIPFEGHNSDKQRIINVQERASIAHVVSSETSHTRAFIARNEYMVDNSDIVIAFLDDANEARDTEKSGTFNAVSYAKEQQKTIILFSPSWFESDWPSVSRIRVL